MAVLQSVICSDFTVLPADWTARQVNAAGSPTASMTTVAPVPSIVSPPPVREGSVDASAIVPGEKTPTSKVITSPGVLTPFAPVIAPRRLQPAAGPRHPVSVTVG